MLKIQGVRRPDDIFWPEPPGIQLLSFSPTSGGGQGPQGELFLRGTLSGYDERSHKITARRDGSILFTEPSRSYTLNLAELAQLNAALLDCLNQPLAPIDPKLRGLVTQMQQKVQAALVRPILRWP